MRILWFFVNITMDESKVQSFIDEPTQEGLNELRKAELMEVARLLEVPIRSSDRKGEIKDTMKQFFVTN